VLSNSLTVLIGMFVRRWWGCWWCAYGPCWGQFERTSCLELVGGVGRQKDGLVVLCEAEMSV